MDNDEQQFSDVLNKYLNTKRYYHFEGDSGLDRLNDLCYALGYKGHNFKYGSSLEEFLVDNPGAVNAIIDWIQKVGDDNDLIWRDNLMKTLED